MKHTPGPWTLVTVPTTVGSCHKIGPFPNGTRSETFACVYADGHRLGIDDVVPAATELSANARLIAAAPDLLEALKALRMAREQDKYQSWEKGSPDFKKAESLSDAAIAKATGEQE